MGQPFGWAGAGFRYSKVWKNISRLFFETKDILEGNRYIEKVGGNNYMAIGLCSIGYITVLIMKSRKKEIDYENIQPEELTGEEAEFEVQPETKIPAYCIDCHIKMEPAKIDIKRGNIMMMNVNAYRCPKCGKKLLDVETFSRIEREFALRHTEEIKGYEVKISSDGRNYLIRFPKELSKMLSTKRFAKILPEFVVKVVCWECQKLGE